MGEFVATFSVPFGAMLGVHVRNGERHDGMGIFRVVRVADINSNVISGYGNLGGNDRCRYGMSSPLLRRTGNPSDHPFSTKKVVLFIYTDRPPSQAKTGITFL